MQLVTDAISAGVFNDLGSGSNVDLCVMMREKTEYIRPQKQAALKGTRYLCQIASRVKPGFLSHDLMNPLNMSIRPYICTYVHTYVHVYVRTSTIKLNAATNQIVVFVKVDESFMTI